MKQAKTKKTDRKWLCPKCQGDVRLPPPLSVANGAVNDDGEPTKMTICNEKINQEEEYVKEALDLTTVMCALKCCPTPRYHLTCSGVPKGSQIFRNTIISCQTAANGAVAANMSSPNKIYHAKHILEHLYSSEGVWWDLPTDTSVLIDGKQCSQKSQRSLQNDKDWPTSMLSFMCPDCDVEGKSRYLSEYFERFHSMKASFYEEYLTTIDFDDMGYRLDGAEESVETRTGEAFLWHLMKDNRKDYLKKSQIKGMPRNEKEKKFSWNPSEIRLKNVALVLTFLSKELQQQQMQQQQRRQKRQKNSFHLDPSYLVGMPVRLFNPIDNSYHSGRVLDYKVNAPYKVDQPLSNSKPFAYYEAASAPDIGQLTDGKICSTLFLVRFRHGVEGRKISVHQWIYLEEHAVTIGGEVCWANVGNHFVDAKTRGTRSKCTDHGNLNNVGSGAHVLKSDARLQAQKKEYISQYRPVQILFRSMLEMIPVQNLNPSILITDSKNSCVSTSGEKSINETHRLNVLAIGFGQRFSHVRLSLGDNGVKNVKTLQSELNKTHKPALSETDTIPEPTKPVAIPITSSYPPWFDRILLRAQLSDEDVALSLAAACTEKEEERRIRTWLRLSVSHLSPPSFIKRNRKAFSVATPTVASNNITKKPRTECSTPCTEKSSSSSLKMAFNQDVSLEVAASLGCSKCMKELKTGSKSNRSHDEECPRRKNFHPVSLEVAASFGCMKCIKELKTGVKSNKSHDQICPRRKTLRTTCE